MAASSNLASIASKEGNADMRAYSAAKGAVIAFTKSIAKESAGTEIRINAVAPAIIETELLNQMAAETFAAVKGKVQLGRPGRLMRLPR